MFDFISYVLQAGIAVSISPSVKCGSAVLEVRDPKDGFCEKCLISTEEIKACDAQADNILQFELDRMAAEIGRKKAGFYSARQRSRELMEREKLFRGE